MFIGLLSIATSVVAFLIIFSLLILIHELGHFAVAKWSGVKVEEFGMGLPPKAKVLWKKGETEYTLNWIPFGGFVRMLGEDDPTGTLEKNPRSFSAQPIWKRTAIAAAGVIMNLFLGYVLLVVCFLFGMRPLSILPDSLPAAHINSYLLPSTTFAFEQGILKRNPEAPLPVTIEKIEPNSKAEELHITPKSGILRINNQPLNTTFDYLKQYREIEAGQEITLELQDTQGSEYKKTFIKPKDQPLGVYLYPTYIINESTYTLPWYKAPLLAAEETGKQVYMTLLSLKDIGVSLVTKLALPSDIGGPLAIATTVHDVKEQDGFFSLILLTIILTINLGVFNILPIPALDGGRIFFMLYELVLRKKPDQKIEVLVHYIGYCILLLLILGVTFNDISRLIHRFFLS